MTLIRERDSRVLVIIRETPHEMSCYNQLPENDQKACKKAYHKTYYAKNRERVLTQQKRYSAENVEILKTRRKRWYQINKKRLASSQRAYCQQNKEHIGNYTEDNTIETTGNGSTNIREVIMPRIRNGSSKDFVTKSKEN